MLKGNKGEWSEVYAFFKLLGDKNLFPGNAKLEKIPDVVYPILRIIRNEITGTYEYSIQDDIVIVHEKVEIARIPISAFKENAANLFNLIKESDGSFAIPDIEAFMNSIYCSSLKAKSSVKSDIRIVIHDQKTNQQPTLGFSIKSQLGNPSTLLNAGKTTNFIFKIKNVLFSENEILKINSITTKSKIKDRLSEIKNSGGTLEFFKAEKSIFSNNLVLIDSCLPKIISEVVFLFFSTNSSTVVDLVEKMEQLNSLKFDQSSGHKFYEYKIKRFLTDTALGMQPATVWAGQYDATGGYLVVKKDGDILCYHIYNKNEFEEYLVNNTKLDTASSTRHDFGTIYENNGEYFFKLNLQIRFID